MCLYLTNSKKYTAKEDIVVYKALKNEKRINAKIPLIDLHGKDFIAIIRNNKVTGKLSVKEDSLFLCHNNDIFDGDTAKNKFGYDYSWVLDSDVTSIIVDENELFEVGLVTPYKHFPVDIGETYKSKLNKSTNDTVDVGLHSFKSMDGPKTFRFSIVAKCIIPKGSKYYFGLFGGSYSYASNCLKYVEIIEEN